MRHPRRVQDKIQAKHFRCVVNIIINLDTKMNINAFLLAIAMVETGGDDTKIGKAGERSQYQISEGVWNERMAPWPFVACSGPFANACAYRHVYELIGQLQTTSSYQHNPVRTLAYSWNRGANAARRAMIQRGKHPPGSRFDRIWNDDYAQRVENLYLEYANDKNNKRDPARASN